MSFWTGKYKDWIVSLFFVETAMIFVPSSLFLGNIDEFRIDYIQLFPYIFFPAVILAVILILILTFLPSRASKWACNLIFGITMGIYIQTNFLNKNLLELNGNLVINWNYLGISSIMSTLIWLLCIAIPIVLDKKKGLRWETIRSYICSFFFLVQAVTLIILCLMTMHSVTNDSVVTKNGEFELASDKNVIVFIVDTLDSKWAKEYIVENEKWNKTFSDFVFFDNVVSGGAPTILGMPALLTGMTWDDPYNVSLDEYYNNAYSNSSLFSDLVDEDVSIKLYTSLDCLNHADLSLIDNTSKGRYELKSGI
jgi:hypothetical protein